MKLVVISTVVLAGSKITCLPHTFRKICGCPWDRLDTSVSTSRSHLHCVPGSYHASVSKCPCSCNMLAGLKSHATRQICRAVMVAQHKGLMRPNVDINADPTRAGSSSTLLCCSCCVAKSMISETTHKALFWSWRWVTSRHPGKDTQEGLSFRDSLERITPYGHLRFVQE